MIQIVSLSKYFGPQCLFDDITWQLDRFRRTALVGHNGAGKSTMLRIIAGEIDADGGQVVIPKGVRIGYLPQEITQMASMPAIDYVLSGRQEIIDLETELEEAHMRVDADPSPENTAIMGDLQLRFEMLGGYALRSQAQSIMASLGFDPAEFGKLTSEFSGGWQMRVLLAQLLLSKPELLLLDEPTNHLDIASLAWLESFLANYPGVLVIVSHDRAFLNRVVDGVVALDVNGLLLYPGNYDHYLELREMLEGQLKKSAEQQRQIIADKQAFIERFRSKASKAKQVQSRIKQLEKMESVQLLQNRKKVSFRFPSPERTPNVVLELQNASKAYGDNVVYQNIDFRIYRGDKLALIAPNGAGKSTLLKMLADAIPFEGERLLADRVTVAHFAQHQVDALDFSKTLLQEAQDGLPSTLSMTQLRSALGAFLFTSDDIDKPVSVLSGGEKNKLALAKILLRAPNLLLLDEPTNHLDLDSREALENALIEFPASIVVISHDRWFVDKVCNKVVAIENGLLEIFEGNYSEYEAHVAMLAETRVQAGLSDNAAESSNVKKQKRIESAQQRQAIQKATKNIQKRLDKSEKETHQLEKQIADIDAQLSDPESYKNADLIKSLNITKTQCQESLELALEAWMMAQEELDEAIKSLEG